MISNIETNGAAYGIRLVKFNGSCVSNTVELNNGSGKTGDCFAFYGEPASAGQDSMFVLNNYFSITHHGSGQKYCSYYTNTTRSRIDYNRYFLAAGIQGTNALGYINTPLNSFAQWQAQGMDLHGTNFTVDPNAGNPISCATTTTNGVETAILKGSILTLNATNLFPNPAGPYFYKCFGYEAERFIDVIDLSGRCISSLTSGACKLKVTNHELPADIYFAKVRSRYNTEVLKLLVN